MQRGQLLQTDKPLYDYLVHIQTGQLAAIIGFTDDGACVSFPGTWFDPISRQPEMIYESQQWAHGTYREATLLDAAQVDVTGAWAAYFA